MNLVERFLDRFGSLPDPEQLHEHARVRARTSQSHKADARLPRARAAIERRGLRLRGTRSLRAFASSAGERRRDAGSRVRRRCGDVTSLVGKARLRSGAPDAPHLVFDWRPDAAADVLDSDVARVEAIVSGTVTGAICPHPGGAPVCWCRPPLPGLVLAFARTCGIDPSQSLLVGATPAHRTLATTLGATYRAVNAAPR